MNDILVSNYENISMINIEYKTSSLIPTALDQLLLIIDSNRFKQELIDYIESEDDEECFSFLKVITTTESGGDGDNDKEDEGINILDFGNYGTTEYLIVIVSALALCICLA